MNKNSQVESYETKIEKYEKSRSLLITIIVVQAFFTFALVILLNSVWTKKEALPVDKPVPIEVNEANSEVDYDKIEAMIVQHIEKVDYDRIETIVEENQAQVEKDFGEKFEEMTSYFGEQFRGFVDKVNDKINN